MSSSSRPDGSATELAPGTNGHATVPGEGVIFMWAGAARATIAQHGTIKETERWLIMDSYSSLCGLPRRLIVAQLESRASA